jgi:endonuclease/exonuclease/phosphatase family metal-dependent hydrolase
MRRAGLALVVLAGLAGGGCVTSSAGQLAMRELTPPAADAPVAREPVRVLLWNIGYAGLGAEADFIAEGGRRLRPRDADTVRANAAGVAEMLAARRPDIVLMQELAGPGLMTRNVDVADTVRRALPTHEMVFSPDVASRLWPGTVRLVHGPASLFGVRVGRTAVVDLPDEPHALAYLIDRNYHALATDIEIAGRPWTFINVHLAAYETTGVRERQLAALLAYAEGRQREGRAIVIGGDFNMALRSVDFGDRRAGSGDDDRPFPRSAMPEGWSLLADPARPTIRAKDGPYVKGETATSIIDGFIVSPGVRVVQLATLDTGFEHTDHQPVWAEFAWGGE